MDFQAQPVPGLKPPPSLPSLPSRSSSTSSSPTTTTTSSSTNATSPSPSSSCSNLQNQDSSSGKKNNPIPASPVHSSAPAQPDLKPDFQPLAPPRTGLETEVDNPSRPPLNDPTNPHSVHRSPSQPMFVMPSLDGFCNQLLFDGNPYAHFFDPRHFSPENCQSASSAASHVHQSQAYFSLPRNYPDSNRQFDHSKATPNWDLSTSALTPSATCSSRQPSELLNDDGHSSSSSYARSATHSSPTCSKLGSRQAPSPSPYSRSGFDLMGALARVVTRPDPKIQVGPVDASAALVVVDARQQDYPIIFASPSFSLLTGYETSEIIGQNCRFLQKPSNGTLAKKVPTESTDPSATRQIRSHIQAGQEIQSSIVNYRKDGQAFINLVTVIPIAWDSSEISHFVGFQVDIVSLTNKLGIPASPQSRTQFLQACELNTFNASTASVSQKSPSSSPKRQKLSALPSLPNESRSGLADLVTGHCYYQTVLNECRDLILVITLKGTLLYVSPSCESILGYQEEMLLNQNISTFCHPGDLTCTLRQLKLIGNKSCTPIDLVFRAINKQGESFWIESQGQLHLELGKGRKYLVVVGRRREIGPLPWQAIRSVGGLGENEFWMKLSLDGLCLFATRPVREILSFEPSDMVGKSLTQLSSPAEHVSIINAIRSAYEGNDVVTLWYSLKDRFGKAVKVVGHFYPPHYSSGPRACGMPLPSSKMSNPPPVIFCQLSLLNTGDQGLAKNRAETLAHPLCTQSSPKDSMATAVKAHSSNQFPSCNSTSREISGSDDDLFGRLGVTRATNWNYEFGRLKRQNHQLLRSVISQKGPSSGRSRNNVSTRARKIHSASKCSPYQSRVDHHHTSPQEVAGSAADTDPSAIYFDDNMVFEFNHTVFPEDENLETSFAGFYP